MIRMKVTLPRKSRTIARGVRATIAKSGPSVRLGAPKIGVTISRRGIRPTINLFGIRFSL